jgi:hypothetical protein
MTDQNLSHIDILAIETRARALRAEAARDLVAAISKFVRGRFTATAETNAAHTPA